MVRNQRLHIAVARDMQSFQSHPHSIESAVTAIANKLDSLHAYMKPDDCVTGYEATNAIDELATRIERMELLLLRTSITDSNELDTELAQVLPRTVGKVLVSQPEEKASLALSLKYVTSGDTLAEQLNTVAIEGLPPKCPTFDLTIGDADVKSEYNDASGTEVAAILHEPANASANCPTASKSDAELLLDRLAAADDQRKEIEVITEGIRMAVEKAESLILELPLERSTSPRRALDALHAQKNVFLNQRLEARTPSQCKNLMVLAMNVLQKISDAT